MGGFQGFENEPFRQECLRTVFRESYTPSPHRRALLQRSYKSHITFQDYSSDIPDSLQTQYPRHKLESQSYENFSGRISRDSIKTRFGMSTGYGLTQGQHYDRISSISTPYLPYVVPPLQAHGKRVPINILPEDEIYEDEEDKEEEEEQQLNQLPSPTRAGVLGPPGTAPSEFQSVNNAMTVHQYSNTWKNLNTQRQSLCSSHQLLTKDRTRHLGQEYTPESCRRDNLTPMTASQEIGSQIWQNLYQRPKHGLRGCKETRFAQTMLIMAKSPCGHHGQSCI